MEGVLAQKVRYALVGPPSLYCCSYSLLSCGSSSLVGGYKRQSLWWSSLLAHQYPSYSRAQTQDHVSSCCYSSGGLYMFFASSFIGRLFSLCLPQHASRSRLSILICFIHISLPIHFYHLLIAHLYGNTMFQYMDMDISWYGLPSPLHPYFSL